MSGNSRNEIRDMAKEDGCAICGLKDHPCVFDFHHKNSDRAGKKNCPGNLINRGDISGFLEEIAKCILVCGNCHRKITLKIIADNNYPTINIGPIKEKAIKIIEKNRLARVRVGGDKKSDRAKAARREETK